MNKTPLVFICLVVCPTTIWGQVIKLTPERQKLAEQASRDRLAYAHSAKYNPYDSLIRELRKSVWKSIDEKLFQAAITEADKGLAIDPVDIEILMGKAVALRELKDSRADQVRAQWMALADSILVSGDGKSYTSAFKVVSVDEEYSVIRLMGLEDERQTLQADHGSMFDVLTVHPRGRKEAFNLYFNIDLPWSRLNSSFGGKK